MNFNYYTEILNKVAIPVTTKRELKEAVELRVKKIIVEGKLALVLAPLASLKNPKKLNINSNMNKYVLANSITASLPSLAVPVAITLIITVGLVTIVAILKNYNIEYSDGRVILTRN